MKKMLLVDGNSVLFRAYYATAYGRPMTTSSGIPTNGVFAFHNMLTKAIDLIQPDSIMVAFDSKKKNFRHEIYEDYKGGRKAAPDELVIQFSIAREYLDAFNICRYEQEGIEADDIIGSMVKKYPDWDINVLSSDHDLLQVIDDTTSVWLMKSGISEIQEMTKDTLKETMGIEPCQIIDLKGLMGDASDNIPGVPKVGEKTALKLLAQFESVEGVLSHVDEIPGKLHDNLVEHAELALMSKLLATIKVDEDIDVDLSCMMQKPVIEKQIAFFQKYEMNSLIKKLKEKTTLSLFDEEPIETEKRISTGGNIVSSCPQELFHDDVAIYLEHNFDSVYGTSILGIALADKKQSIYMTLDELRKDQACLDFLKSDAKKIVWDAKKMKHWMDKDNLEINNLAYDTMIAAFLCDTNCTSLERTLSKYNVSLEYTLDMIYGKENKPILPDIEKVTIFSCRNAQFIYDLYLKTSVELTELEMEELFYGLEMPLASILFEMEKEGVTIEQNIMNRIADETKAQVDELNEMILKYSSNINLNLNSPKQLAEFLFDELKLPENKKRSTSVEILEKLLGQHEVIKLLMQYRKVQKQYSTYAEGLKKSIMSDSKIHTIYNQCVTSTGRLSSTSPNLQNISIRDEESREIRKAFIPSEGNYLLAADYSQVELRVLAHMANEEKLIEAFTSGLDIHTKTAMEVFDLNENEVSSLHRRHAKAVNFGIVYGISDFGLANQLEISKNEAQQFIDRYLESYPNISIFMDKTVEECQRNGYVKTLLNRRRFIPEVNSEKYFEREAAKRAAMNAPIQGTAADLIKVAMINVDREIKRQNLKSKMILQVHDELIFDVYPDEVEMMKQLVVDQMIHAMNLKVPLDVQCQVGKDWYEAK